MKQIRIMGKIYTNATNTILYLGPADPKSVECQCIKTIHDGKIVDGIRMIEQILSKEWFNRVWMFQELIFSNNPWVQCGRTRVKWERISSAVDKIQFGTLEVTQCEKLKVFSRIKTAWDSHRRPNNNWPNEEDEVQDMLALLRARRGLGVTDPRDMVFAHTVFAANTLEDGDEYDAKSGSHLDPDLEADYSMSCADVYLSAARHIIKRGKRLLEFMKQVDDRGNSPSRIAGLPSWVPDWTTPKIMSQMPCALGRYWYKHSTTPGRLLGAILAFAVESPETVVSTSIELSLVQIPHGFRQKLALKLGKAMFDDIERNNHCYLLEQHMDDIDEVWPESYEIWRQLVQDDDILPSERWPQKLKGNEMGQNMKNSPIPFFLILALHPHYDLDHLTGRAFARTSSGKLAIVPTSTQKGDIIVRLFTGDWHFGEVLQFVLRPFQIKENREKLDMAIINSTMEANFVSDKIATWRRHPVLHCKVIGQCIMGSFGGYNDWQIVAIH